MPKSELERVRAELETALETIRGCQAQCVHRFDPDGDCKYCAMKGAPGIG